MKFSACTSSYNSEEVLGAHLRSIYSQFSPDQFEYVVMDNCSEDATALIYEQWRKKYGNITLISKKCWRGKSRQLTFQASKTETIVQVDCDMIFNAHWGKVIRWFLRERPNFALVLRGTAIYPRHFIMEIGGWRNLQQGEDLDVYFKLFKKGKIKFCPLIVVSGGKSFWRTKSKSRVKNYFRLWRDAHDAFLLHRLKFWETLHEIEYPKVQAFFGLLTAKFVAKLRGLYWDVIDISEISDEEVRRNYIDLGIQGEYGDECFPGLEFKSSVPSKIALRALLEKVKSH